MAKTKLKSGSFSHVNEFLAQYDPEGEILSEFTPMEIKEWIHTGSYIQNAHISGSLMKGMPSGRMWTISGDPKTGKSFVLFNVMRRCIEMGYIPILIETEASPDKDRFVKQKIDTTKIRITQPDTAKAAANFLGPMLHDLSVAMKENAKIKDVKKKRPIPKLAIFIDSINGFMASTQLKSAIGGEMKTDMGTSATEVGDLFKLLVKKCALLNIPVVVTAHTTIERTHFGSRRKPKGGQASIFYSSIVTMLEKKFERDEDTKERTGIMVKSYLYESRYAAYKDVGFYIPFHKGINPYYGLQEYLSWENCGVARGKWDDRVDLAYEFIGKKLVTEKDIVGFKFDENFLKKNIAKGKIDNIYANVEWMVKDGLLKNTGKGMEWAFTDKILKRFIEGKYPKPTGVIHSLNTGSPKWIARHLEGETLETQQLFSSKVFTQDVLKELDESAIRPIFELKGGSEEDVTDISPKALEEDFFTIEEEEEVK